MVIHIERGPISGGVRKVLAIFASSIRRSALFPNRKLVCRDITLGFLDVQHYVK